MILIEKPRRYATVQVMEINYVDEDRAECVFNEEPSWLKKAFNDYSIYGTDKGSLMVNEYDEDDNYVEGLKANVGDYIILLRFNYDGTPMVRLIKQDEIAENYEVAE